MNTFFKIIRDPIWQAAGVLVGIVSIFLTISTSTPLNGELAIIKTQSISFADYLLPSKLITLNLPSASKDMDGAIVEYYTISNNGTKPILPTDYTAQLSVELNSGGEILLVDTCAQPTESQASMSASSCKPGSFVSSSWHKQDGKWVQDQVLLNPTEQLCVVVIRKNRENEKIASLSWNGRIVGSKISTYASLDEYSKTLKKGIIYYIQTSIHLEGYGAYWFVILQVSIFYSTLLLARQARWAHSSINSPLWSTVVVMILSTSTSEILVDIFINQNTNNLSLVVWPLLVSHVLLILYLFIRAFKLRAYTISTTP
jgi:hypothetical protein